MPSSAPLSEADARRQARKERAFYRHLAQFVVVMAGLAAINLLASPGYLWFLWPLLGWGVGLASHAAATFGSRRGEDWLERRTTELMGAEASEARLRQLLDETLDARSLPAGEPQDLARLQRRIEHLEAIVTATDDPADVVPSRLDLDAIDEGSKTDAAPEPSRRRVR